MVTWIKRLIITVSFLALIAANILMLTNLAFNAAIPAESIPFLGVSVLIAGTGYELYEACQSIKDLDQMYAEMGMTDETADDVLRSVCNPILPEPGQVWGGVVEWSAP